MRSNKWLLFCYLILPLSCFLCIYVFLLVFIYIYVRLFFFSKLDTKNFIYILIRNWIALWFFLWFCLSVILFVRYRNHFPVVQFQNQAHIRKHHGTGKVFKTIWVATSSPKFLFIANKGGEHAAPSGAPPNFVILFLLPPPKPEVSQMRRRRCRSPGERGKSRRRRVFREYI